MRLTFMHIAVAKVSAKISARKTCQQQASVLAGGLSGSAGLNELNVMGAKFSNDLDDTACNRHPRHFPSMAPRAHARSPR